MLPQEFSFGQFFKCLFQFKQPVSERITLHSLESLCVGVFGQCIQLFPLHVHSVSRVLCALEHVCSCCVCDQDTTEAFKKGLCPSSTSTLLPFEAMQLDVYTFGRIIDPDARFHRGRLALLLENLHRCELCSGSAVRFQKGRR